MLDLTTLSSLMQDNKEIMWWIAAVSVAIFVGSLFVVPWLVVRIPAGYFVTQHRPQSAFANEHYVLRWTGLVLKNLLGGALVLSGIAMLLLPGQGLLTIAIGILLLDFPGKHKLEGKLIRVGPIQKSINWLRRRANVEPLQIEPLQIGPDQDENQPN